MRKNQVDNVRSYFRKKFDIDIIRSYEKLKSIGAMSADQINDRVALMKAINKSGKNAFLANLLFLKARREREIFRIEFDKTMRDLNRKAIAMIGVWMENSTNIRKQITVDMVKQEISGSAELREQYKTILIKQEELREIRDAMESLAKQWADRKSSLQSQARLLDSKKEVILGFNKNSKRK